MVSLSKNRGKGKARDLGDDVSDEEFATQGFVPHKSDAEQLWDVVEIRGERNGKYLVEWDGVDENGKPWPNSWVPREDVTDDLVEAWKKKALAQKEKARKAAERRGKKRQASSGSASRSRIDSKGSIVTRSSATATARCANQFSSVTTVGRAETTSVSTNRSSPSTKRKQSIPSDADGHELRRKRRKTVDSFPPKKSKRRLPDSEAEEEHVQSDAHRYNKTRSFPELKEREGSEDVQSPPRRQTNPHNYTKRTGKLSAPVGREEEEEEGEEEEENAVAAAAEEEEKDKKHIANVEERFKVTNDTPEKPPPYVFISPKTGSRPGNDSSVTVAPKNGRPDAGRIHNSPTPPRCTLAKSHSGSAAAPTRNKVKKRTKRGRPPGVRVVGDQPRIEPPSSSSSQILNDHSDSDAAEKGSPQGRSRSQSRLDEMSPISITSPSKLRQGLTSRMKGKGKSKPDSGMSSPKSVSAQPSPTSPIEFENEFADEDAVDLAYDCNTFDDPFPVSQDVEPLLPDAGAPISQVDAEPEKKDIAAVDRGPEIVPNVGPAVQEGQHDAVGLSRGTVIPTSQSQSQSQYEVQLASILAEHGSPAQRMDVDAEVSIAPALLVSSLEAEIQPDSTDTFVTDPESSANANAMVYKKIPVVTPSKFSPYLPQQRLVSTLPPPHIQGMNVLARGAELSSSLESPVRDFDIEDGATPRRESRSNSEPSTSGSQNELDEEGDIEGIISHGFELAEIQRQRMQEEIREPAPRIHLGALLEERARKSGSRSESRSSEIQTTSGSDLGAPHNPVGLLEETKKLIEEEDEEARIRRFEEEYLDFDRNAGASIPASVPDNAAGSTLDEQVEDEEPLEPGDDASEVADVESSLQDVDEEDDPFRARDDRDDRSATSTTTSSQQDDTELSYTPRFKILGSPSKLEMSATETPSRQLDEAMSLLHAKSEEIERLKGQLAEIDQRRLSQDDALADLRAENAVIKKTHESQPDASVNMDEGSLGQYKEICETLTRDRHALDAEIKLLKLNRDDAVKQAAIFRELYGKASSFADEMKQENAELLARAKLAEGQVEVGLELILETRDTRTDYEVRRRAAMEPELQRKIVELKEDIRDLEISQSNVLRERNDLLVKKQELNDKLFGTMRSNYNPSSDKGFKLVRTTYAAAEVLDSAEIQPAVLEWVVDGQSHHPDSLDKEWSAQELAVGRRLIRFCRGQSGNKLQVSCKIIPQEAYDAKDIVISCVYRQETRNCWFTSPDVIYLLECLLGGLLPDSEKYFIYRHLEGSKPTTISKTKGNFEMFFQRIIDFPAPKPRKTKKAMKVFPWAVLALAIEKIIAKYSVICRTVSDSSSSSREESSLSSTGLTNRDVKATRRRASRTTGAVTGAVNSLKAVPLHQSVQTAMESPLMVLIPESDATSMPMDNYYYPFVPDMTFLNADHWRRRDPMVSLGAGDYNPDEVSHGSQMVPGPLQAQAFSNPFASDVNFGVLSLNGQVHRNGFQGPTEIHAGADNSMSTHNMRFDTDDIFESRRSRLSSHLLCHLSELSPHVNHETVVAIYSGGPPDLHYDPHDFL